MNKPKGFATWSPEKIREAARKGGKAAHAAGTAHEFSSEEAAAAGRIGGLARHGRKPAPMANGEPDTSTDEKT